MIGFSLECLLDSEIFWKPLNDMISMQGEEWVNDFHSWSYSTGRPKDLRRVEV